MEETPQKETGVSFIRVWDCFVDVFRPGCKRIRFRVNHRKGWCITFTDRREVLAGTADATGIWNTRPALAGGQASTSTPTGFQAEVSVDRSGAGRRNRPGDYGEIFFGVANDICQTKCVAAERESMTTRPNRLPVRCQTPRSARFDVRTTDSLPDLKDRIMPRIRLSFTERRRRRLALKVDRLDRMERRSTVTPFSAFSLAAGAF